MSTEWEIEHDWEMAKLLVTRMNSYKMFLYSAGAYGVYVQSLRPANRFIESPVGVKYHFGSTKDPHVVVVRSKTMDNIHTFIQTQPQFGIMKIFKHGLNFKSLEEDVVKGFASTNVINMMGLLKGAIFNIQSNNKGLRDLFYQKAVEHNAEHGFDCRFDYDEYDFELLIKAYKRYKDKKHVGWSIFTVLSGEDMPNRWSS